MDKELFFKKLSEVVDDETDSLLDNHSYEIKKLKEILNTEVNDVIYKVINDNIYTSINEDLIIKNIEIKYKEKVYEIESILLKKLFVLHSMLLESDVKNIMELHFLIAELDYEEYKNIYLYFKENHLDISENDIELINDFDIKTSTEFKVVKTLNSQMDRYKRHTLRIIKDLL